MPLKKFLDSNCKVPVSNIFWLSCLLICWKCTLTWQGPWKVWRALMKGKFFPIFLLLFPKPKNHSFLPTYPVLPYSKVLLWPMPKHGKFCRFGCFWDQIIWLFLWQRFSKDTENRDLIIHVVLFWWWWWDLDAKESFDLRFVPEEVVWPAPEHNGSISLIIFLTQSLLLQWNRVVQVVFPVEVFRPWLLLDIVRPVIRALGQT